MKHFETTYATHDGLQLYLQSWMPERPVASLLLIHGLGEHSSRYLHLAKALVAMDVAVFTFDGRGHGKSQQPLPTAYFHSYEDYLKDIHALYGKVKTYFPAIPTFIFGHSMGGGLLAAYVIKYEPEASGVILSAAAIKPSPNISKALVSVSSMVSRFAPKFKVLKLDSTKISHDTDEVRKYDQDPLIYHDSIPARTGYELLKMMWEIDRNSSKFKLPVLLLHGTADVLTNPHGSEQFYEKISSTDKTLKVYPELYHELINEVEKEAVIKEITGWIAARLLPN